MIALTIILGYVLMVWVTSLIMGIFSWDNEMDEFEWIMAGFWPLTISALIVAGIGYFFSWLWSLVPGRVHAENVLMKMCIIFRPFEIGSRIKRWMFLRKDKRFLKKLKEKEASEDEPR